MHHSSRLCLSGSFDFFGFVIPRSPSSGLSSRARRRRARDLLFLSTTHYPLLFKSRSNRSKALLYDSCSLHFPNSPICRVRRMSAAHACLASITASSTRMGNSTGFPLLCSRSNASPAPPRGSPPSSPRAPAAACRALESIPQSAPGIGPRLSARHATHELVERRFSAASTPLLFCCHHEGASAPEGSAVLLSSRGGFNP